MKTKFLEESAVGCTDNTDYRGKHTKLVTGSEEAISTPGLFPVNVPGCEGARETQKNNFSFLTFCAGGEDRNAQAILKLSMTATLAPEYPILSERKQLNLRGTLSPFADGGRQNIYTGILCNNFSTLCLIRDNITKFSDQARTE